MKKIFCLIFALIMLTSLSLAVFANDTEETLEDYGIKYVIDIAPILSDDEIEALDDKIEALAEEYKFNIYILTVSRAFFEESPNYSENDLMEFADDFYDSYELGYGENRDGAVLLCKVNDDGSYYEGGCWISTCGNGITYLNDDNIQKIGDKITPDLLDGDYKSAFEKYVDMSYKYAETNGKGEREYNIPLIIGVALVIGVIGALGYTGNLKKQLKTVETARDANNYLVQNSLKITRSHDLFLYRHISRTKRKKDDDSSSTHTSSSGSTHGGGGF